MFILLFTQDEVSYDRFHTKGNQLYRVVLNTTTAGHADNVGDPRLNQSLSEYRARVVMNYLIRHGIAGDRVGAMGYGGSRPVAGNDTETGRAKNRRVKFVVK